MARKDYIKIGEILKRGEASDSIIEDFIEFFKSDNPLFDESIFRKFVGASLVKESKDILKKINRVLNEDGQ